MSLLFSLYLSLSLSFSSTQPVFYAAAKGDVLLMQLLVDAGANPAAECAYGETPSVVAYSNEHVAAADWLDGITSSSSSQKGAPRSIARGIERSSHTERFLQNSYPVYTCIYGGPSPL